jgi:hypothetical protein
MLTLKKKLIEAYGRRVVSTTGVWFVDIPRTSSTSIRAELGSRYGWVYGKSNIVEREYSTRQAFRDHMTAREMRDLLGGDIWARLITFSIVRDPWTRTFSMYNYRKKKQNIPEGWSFRDYVCALGDEKCGAGYFEYPGFSRGAYDYIYDEYGNKLVDYVIRFEDRESGLAHVSSKLGFNLGSHVAVQGATPTGASYIDFYDDKMVGIISDLYQKDIVKFGYTYGGNC